MLNLKYPPLKALRQNIHLKNLDSAMLGWVRPDKTINFQTEHAAQSFAKNKVVKALNAKKTYEKAFLLKQNRVVAECNGNRQGVNIQELLNTDARGMSLVHGHPDVTYSGNTVPLSLADYLVMLTNKLDKMIAYNSKGEYNMLEKCTKNEKRIQKLLPQKLKNIVDFLSTVGAGSMIVEKYAKGWASLFPKEIQSAVEQMMHVVHDDIFANQKMVKSGKQLFEDSVFMKRIGKLEKEKLLDGSAAKYIDEFWKKNAQKVGLKYSTDFSHLK